MKIQRGKPKKETDEAKVVEKIDKPHHQKGSLNINRLYVDKNGSRCLVTYSECKDKPEIIQGK